ncbi:Type II secretion system protein G [Pseudidiomarina piscicola]|uniref:Type II secretion system protein G n=1 Tax=Pseudidiomarina piscicola TaxID=2614830 RepID=A0A6S6WR62_9GAMM|nr:prepilin-type N-terminal cleavage/methylation domain-containing protein [Pseudidiomarina piscicola]CAB0150565.1 Type II secretion system protein G [Pseudidiomarina piscicola]VZT40063.1 Type II secretion system protein G [Pseudomonas aeruginosa]
MKQKGFTLIELIIVIVVLGILAVTAAPQFINFSSDARESTVKGAQASIQGAMQLVYAKSLIDGDDGEPTGTVTTEGGDVSTVYGYPAAKGVDPAGGIQLAAGISGSEWDIDDTTSGEITFSPKGAATGCSVTYTQAEEVTSSGSSTITPAKVSVAPNLEDNC